MEFSPAFFHRLADSFSTVELELRLSIGQTEMNEPIAVVDEEKIHNEIPTSRDDMVPTMGNEADQLIASVVPETSLHSIEKATKRKRKVNPPNQSGSNVKQRFKCDQCEYGTAKKSKFDRHMQKHWDNSPHQCEYKVPAHSIVQESIDIIEITDSAYEGGNDDQILNESMVNQEEINDEVPTVGNKADPIDELNTSDVPEMSLDSHTIEQATKPFKFQQCDYVNDYKSYTIYKPYKCDRCSKGYKSKKSLKKHAPVCLMSFWKKNDYKFHLNSKIEH